MSVIPNLTTSLDWALRLTEAGRAGSLIQKYNDRPLLSAAGHKMCFRLSLYVKSIAPLQCYLSKNVSVLTAAKPFTMAEGSFGDERVHICQNETNTFDQVQGHDELFNKSRVAIGHILKAFQVQFNDEIQGIGE